MLALYMLRYLGKTSMDNATMGTLKDTVGQRNRLHHYNHLGARDQTTIKAFYRTRYLGLTNVLSWVLVGWLSHVYPFCQITNCKGNLLIRVRKAFSKFQCCDMTLSDFIVPYSGPASLHIAAQSVNSLVSTHLRSLIGVLEVFAIPVFSLITFPSNGQESLAYFSC